MKHTSAFLCLAACLTIGRVPAFAGPTATYFDVNFGVTDLYSQINSSGYNFTQYLFTNVWGQNTSTTLQFTFEQDPEFYYLDDVVVVPVAGDTGSYSSCTSASGNLVSNCGFETGDFTDWTQFGNTGASGVSFATVNSGSFAAYFGPVGSTGGISQSILGTSAGVRYDISFYLRDDGMGTTYTPEPGTIGLLLSGLGGLVCLRRRRSS